MNTKIFKCKCTNDFQNKKYGIGNRVCNPKASMLNKPQEYRCTVCGATHA